MHLNHRRKNKFRAKHHGERGYMLAYSLKWYRRFRSQTRRSKERDLIAVGCYDDLLTSYPRDIYWDYW